LSQCIVGLLASAALEDSHGRRAGRLRVVLRVDLRRGDFWVTRGLGVGGPPVALGGRRRLVIVAKVVFLLVPGHGHTDIMKTRVCE